MKTEWNQPKYLSNIFCYKSKRRETLLSAINEHFEVDRKVYEKILESFECLHFSVTTVDDIIDNETFRNDQPCYYIREGYDKSFVASFSTFVRFLEISKELGDITETTISFIRRMIISEEADSGLRLRDNRYSPWDWYYEICSTKSSNEMSVMTSLLNSINPNESYLEIQKLFFEIGRYAQMHNDKNDLITLTPLKRFSKNDKVKLTYSLPLSIYLNEIDNSLEQKIGTYLDQDEFLHIHNYIISDFIKNKITLQMQEQYKNIVRIFDANQTLNKPFTEKLVSLITKDCFYNLNQYEILSK